MVSSVVDRVLYTEAFLGAFRIPPLFEAIIMMIMISPLSTSTVAVSIQSAAAKALEPKKESSILRSNAVVDAAAAHLFMLSTRHSSSRQHCASMAAHTPAAIRPVTISTTNPFSENSAAWGCRRRLPPPMRHAAAGAPPCASKPMKWGPAFFDDGKKPVGLGILVLCKHSTENRLSNFSPAVSLVVPWSRPFLFLLFLLLLSNRRSLSSPPRGPTPSPTFPLTGPWLAFRTQSQLYPPNFEAEAASLRGRRGGFSSSPIGNDDEPAQPLHWHRKTMIDTWLQSLVHGAQLPLA